MFSLNKSAASRFVFAAMAVAAVVSGQDRYVSPWKTHWTYEDAARWSTLDPDYAACGGKQQSPVDIRSAKKADLPALRFESKQGPLLRVINNAHTIRVDYKAGNGNFLIADGRRWEMTQFHFHHPGEEVSNGKRYELDVHLVYSTSDGKSAVVAVPVTVGHASPIVQTVWDRMPKSEGQSDVAGVAIVPGELLPKNTADYDTYLGSLTAPPCTEGVLWFVLRSPIEISAEQLKAFAALYPNDARPAQPLNGRIVSASR